MGVPERAPHAAGIAPARGAPAAVPRFRAVVFDLDGVVLNSLDVMRDAFCVAYREVVGAGPPPFDEYLSHLGLYFPDIMRAMDLPLEMEPVFVRESALRAHLVPVYAGVAEMLHALAEAKVEMAVATGKSGARGRDLLETLDLAHYFRAIVGSDEIPRGKPAPDIVIEALDRLGIGPRDAVMVGDAVVDLASGRAAGTAVAAVTWGQGKPEELLALAPDFVLHGPADLLDVVLGPRP